MQRSTISDGQGLSVDVLDYGARIASIKFNDMELCLSYSNNNDYLNDAFYMGASIGPICNRIRDGKLTINKQPLQMPCNSNGHSLHSGNLGFDKRYWTMTHASKESIHYELVYSLNSIGLVGQITVSAIFTVKNGTLRIDYDCKTDTVTYLNLTNHVYLNIDGNDNIAHHEFELFVDSYLEVDHHNIPTGKQVNLESPFTYHIGKSEESELTNFCDHHFNVSKDTDEHRDGLKKLLIVRSNKSDIELCVSSNATGFQFYTGQYLSEPFAANAGFCVEAQLPPNAINQGNFHAPLLMPRENFKHSTLLEFSRLTSVSRH